MTIYLVCIFIIVAAYVIVEYTHDLHMLQQNSYRITRYFRWLKQSGDLTSGWRLTDVALLLLCFSTLLHPAVNFFFVAAVAIYKIIVRLRKKHKKPLVYTSRVKRLYSVCISITVLICLSGVFFIHGSTLYPAPLLWMGILLLMSIFSWAIVILSVVILTPVERIINRRYYKEARDILHGMRGLRVIGITGSYGKTSTKHFLNRILSEEYDVLMTPGSYNTLMGVIRTIREQMKPYNEVFICEMGAKQRGDIKEICDLVSPTIGIVTAVGPMHLETFGSLENVRRTKFELIDSLPGDSDSLAVINNDFEQCAKRDIDNVLAMRYSCGKDSEADYKAKDIEYSEEGSSFTLIGPDGYEARFTTPILGECNISNLIAAIIVSRRLQVPEEKIARAVAQIEPVEHRMSIKRNAGGVTVIDDAFNSNPSGSAMALEVLSNMKGGSRIVVTPGMIELGSEQYALNAELGENIGNSADVAIIVGSYNRDAILEGISRTEMSEDNVYAVETFQDAQHQLQSILKRGDIVLYENDLPDSFK